MAANLCPKCGSALARYQGVWKCNPCNSNVDAPATMAAQGKDPQLVRAENDLAATKGDLARVQDQLLACFVLASTGARDIKDDTDPRWSMAYGEILDMHEDFEMQLSQLRDELQLERATRPAVPVSTSVESTGGDANSGAAAENASGDVQVNAPQVSTTVSTADVSTTGNESGTGSSKANRTRRQTSEGTVFPPSQK